MASSNTTPTSSFFVSTSYEGQYLFGSDIFTNEKDAIELMDFLMKCDPTQFSFELYKMKPTGKAVGFDFTSTTDENTTEHHDSEDEDHDYAPDGDIDISHMTLNKYGKGYLLQTSSSDPLYGTKYFLGGFWMPKHKAWFFRTADAYCLLDYGIVEMEGVTDSTGKYICEDMDCGGACSDADSDFSVLTATDEFTMADSDEPYAELKSFTLKKYGRGYMLFAPSSSHTYYGQKYLGEGFWNSNANGWFFQRHHLKALMNSRIKLIR